MRNIDPQIIAAASNSGHITAAQAIEALSVARQNLEEMKEAATEDRVKNFNPLSGHRSSDPDEFGSSQFLTVESVADLFGVVPSTVETWTVKPGHGGVGASLVLQARTTSNIGTFYGIADLPMIQLTRKHGSLQFVMYIPKPRKTNIVTAVITYEGEKTGWVLASAYPGDADPDPNLEGLKEGDIVDLEEVRRRNARLKISK